MSALTELAHRISQYRELAGASQAELAAEIGIDRTAMSKIEAGTRKVSALELSSLARALEVRMEWFFGDPPASVAAYRQSAPDQVRSTIDSWIERLSREIEFVRRNIGTGWPELRSSRVERAEIDPEQLATKVRVDLGCGDGPIRSMSALAERAGVLLFSIDLGVDSPDGASTPLDGVGLAIVNGHREVGRRRLAAGHELGHLLAGDQYEVDWRLDGPDQSRWEAQLDRFARALLLPAKPLIQAWAQFHTDDFDERSQALRTASHWQVDMSTMARRLLQLDLIDEAGAKRVRGYRHQRADFDELDLVNRTDLDALSIPRQYIRGVLELYRKEAINVDRATDLLLDTYGEADLPQLPVLPEGSIWSPL